MISSIIAVMFAAFILLEDFVLHAHQHDLGGIDHRAAADRNHQISLGVLGVLRNLDHDLAAGVLRDSVTDSCR
jgi:hypothetical protein